MNSAVEIFDLSKTFTISQGYRDLLPLRRRKKIEVLRKVNLQVPEGEIFGILGSNGAGKTTLLKILGTLILPTSGEAFAMGWDVARESREAREVLTYAVNEERSLLWRLTGRQNLNYFAAMNNLPRREAKVRIAELFSLLDLTEAADRRVMFYSSGMRQKLALARGLLRNPEILLLDEPARSVDPLMAHSIWQFIKQELVYQQGMTVLFATHNLEEATNLCDKVAVLHQGQVRACGTVDELTTQWGGDHRYSLTLQLSANGVHRILEETPGVLKVQECPLEGDDAVAYDIYLKEPKVQVPLILERVMAADARVLACTPLQLSLSDVLTSLTTEKSMEKSVHD